MTALVVVEFPTIRLVMDASVATREEKNPLVLVELVEKRLVAVRAEAEAVLRVVWLETVSIETVVVASVEVPSTVNLPFVRRFPCGSAKKFRFSVQAAPFQ